MLSRVEEIRVPPEVIERLERTPGLCYDLIDMAEITLHKDGPECWCEPKLFYADPINHNRIYLHNRKH